MKSTTAYLVWRLDGKHSMLPFKIYESVRARMAGDARAFRRQVIASSVRSARAWFVAFAIFELLVDLRKGTGGARSFAVLGGVTLFGVFIGAYREVMLRTIQLSHDSLVIELSPYRRPICMQKNLLSLECQPTERGVVRVDLVCSARKCETLTLWLSPADASRIAEWFASKN
jgi:hypothetical protein